MSNSKAYFMNKKANFHNVLNLEFYHLYPSHAIAIVIVDVSASKHLYVEYKLRRVGGIMKISCKFSEFDYKRRTEELASEPQSTFPAPFFQTHTGKETQTRRRRRKF